ncbi:Transport of quorum-sensing signal protein [Thiorhodovibrio winogradskyi]|uniref:Transport of quorum-sensing signal protein n=1 Tax=Thiorhodovibrio winogradskyi TaxID=77007 RepID=A0ABZ0S9L8_9GAMM|nr:AI-2E family transporter [Thiorhodovibrio winogradskyi]
MSITGQFSAPARGLIIAGAIALVISLMHLAAPILAPLLLAVFIAVIATPPLRWLRRKGVPKWAALGLIIFVLLDIGSLLALLTTGALEGFRDSFPSYQERFLMLSEQAGGWLERFGMEHSQEAIPDLLDPKKVMGVVRLMLSNASGVLATGLLVLLAVMFILLEAPSLQAKLRAAFKPSPEAEARIGQLFSRLNGYMSIKSLTSLATGALIWIWLAFVGVDFAPLWGILAFLLNFVPTVGSIIAGIPPVLLALVQLGPQGALLATLGFMVVNVGIGNFVEPRVMGRGLGISTLAVFVSLLFWGWLFGLVGMFLAVPLTAALIAALDASPHTRPLAIMLGPELKAGTDADADAETAEDTRAGSC